MKLDTMTWEDRNEDVNGFSQCIRAVAVALPVSVSDELLLDLFLLSIHGCLRNLALVAHGPFDEVVGRMAMMVHTSMSDN